MIVSSQRSFLEYQETNLSQPIVVFLRRNQEEL
jgi:hypothetical protein